MMKKIGTVLKSWLVISLACLFTFSFTACEGKPQGEKEFTGLVFADSSYVYDGKEKDLVLQGAPDDAQVIYENNKRTTAGENDAIVKVNKSGYKEAVLSAKLTISKRPLLISANNAERQEGEENPQFTADISGFADGENESVLKGNLSFSCSADSESPAGTYVIKPEGYTADNYEISYEIGTLTVTGKPIIRNLSVPELEDRIYYTGETFSFNAVVVQNGVPTQEEVTVTGSGVTFENGELTITGNGKLSFTVSADGFANVTRELTAYHKVETLADFNAIGATTKSLQESYILTNDIDATGETINTVAHNDTGKAFSGVFDGNGHTISNCTPTTSTANKGFNCSLFGTVAASGVIRNLNVVNATINTRFGGGIATLNWGTIENCFISATVTVSTSTAANPTGGIASKNAGGKIRNCVAVIKAGSGVTNACVGGIAGRTTNKNSVIENCYLYSETFEIFETSASGDANDLRQTTNAQAVKTAEALKALDYSMFDSAIWDFSGEYPKVKAQV